MQNFLTTSANAEIVFNAGVFLSIFRTIRKENRKQLFWKNKGALLEEFKKIPDFFLTQ